MSDKAPLIVIHRRNRIDQLAGLPKGCWIELDVEIYGGKAYLTHDPVVEGAPLPDLFEAFVPKALAAGVVGFVVDCKRECAEKWVKPVFEKHGVADYFYLNEMEVQADIFQSLDSTHSSGIRIWKYRTAPDVLRFARDMAASGGAFPRWIWVDCWQRGLLDDISKAYLPLTGDEARALQALGVRLCLCSPELYIHKYGTTYDAATLDAMFKGMLAYREKLETAGIVPDSICTKFPHIWLDPVDALRSPEDRARQLPWQV